MIEKETSFSKRKTLYIVIPNEADTGGGELGKGGEVFSTNRVVKNNNLGGEG